MLQIATMWTFYLSVIVTKMITSIIIMESMKCAQDVRKVLIQRSIFGKISSQIAHKKITCTMYFLLAEMFKLAHLVSPQLPAETQISSRQRTLSSVGEAVLLPSTMFSDHWRCACLWGSAAHPNKAITAGQCGCRQCCHLSVLHRLILLYGYF